MADNGPVRASERGPKVAITGATGFVGRALLSCLSDLSVRALCRGDVSRGRAIDPRVTWISGDLSDEAACAGLLTGADVVVHLAGLTKALDAQSFHKVNAIAAGRLAAQAAQAGCGHFVLLSSLAAIRPGASDYAASKAAGEAAVRDAAGAMPVSVIRAPAVFGPGDSATEPLWAGLRRGWIVAPGGSARQSRFSVIDVQDLARDLAGLIRLAPHATAPHAPFSVEAVGFDLMASTAAALTGRRTRVLTLPRSVITLAGHLADLQARLTRRPDVFSSGKVREIYSGNWIAETPVADPTPLEIILRRCLLPNAGAKAVAETCTS